jgi:hypothetical protein
LEWFGDVRPTEVFEMDTIPLIGMKLMRSCRLTMDIQPDGEVELTRI